MTPRSMLLGVVAVLGVVATATVAWAASQLAAPGVGLSDEPPSVVSGLAPVIASPSTHPPGRAATPVPPKRRRRHATPALVTTPNKPAGAPRSASAARPSAPPAPAASATPSTSTTPQHRTQQPRDDSSGGGSADARTRRDD